MCLQELKVGDDAFPFATIRAAGYHAAVHGQRTYNGVAILSKTEPTDIRRGLAGEDAQARLISADVGGIRVLSAYFPNGGLIGSDKWTYKLDWMRRLSRHLVERFDPKQPLALCGDFNVAPEERDVHDPKAWEGTVLFHPDARRGLEEVRRFGLVDTFRLHNPGGDLFSWWDYRMLAFPRNHGLRIDHIFASQPLARLCAAASIDRDQRKGKQPSDHAPVLAEFEL